MTTPQNWQADQQKWAAAEQLDRELAARTIDHVRPGEQQPEVDHQFKGERTNTGQFEDRNWRVARDGGWFSYSLRVNAGEPAKLVCTYWGSDSNGRQFDVLVDGKIVGSTTLENNKPNEFFDVEYALPAELTAGKKRVEVKFQAKPALMAGGWFDCRMIK